MSGSMRIYSCPTCGWWKADGSLGGKDYNQDLVSYHLYAHGALIDLDVSLPETPIEVIRQYLLAQYEKRLELHPRLFEQTVASVFRDLHYSVELTAYSRDGGIDIVLLSDPNGKRIGVQVKRYKAKIDVAQIREFAGALLFGGYTKGIFVTTSGFSSGAQGLEKQSTKLIPIELYDADWFYNSLKLTRRPYYEGINDPDSPWMVLAKRREKMQTISFSNLGFASE